MILALLEGGLLFAAVCGTIIIWVRPNLDGWINIVAVLGQALAVSLCCTVAFYYNGLYDLRIVRS
ncbi:MAG: hypothetical protein ACREKF_09060, partial [Candidatus Methylomirabilales bacterium]